MLGSYTWTDGYDHERSSFAVNAELEEFAEELELSKFWSPLWHKNLHLAEG
jgi:hypothetical protein